MHQNFLPCFPLYFSALVRKQLIDDEIAVKAEKFGKKLANKLRKQLGIDTNSRVENYSDHEEVEGDAYPPEVVKCRTVCYQTLNSCLASRESRCVVKYT